ncbi:MAG TPA: aldehyde dehydrogenase family protein [Bacteroidia bacterium]|nr:aldehyde dehydrogenase family protein [Bacteroidia bacterium]
MARLKILKTYKLYISGQFPRGESGRYYELVDGKDRTIANISLASRKDLRNAVSAAKTAQQEWEERSAFNRGQVLYRIAEMLEGRHSQFVEELQAQGVPKGKAEDEVDLCVDRLVYYAGWCDKYQQVFSQVNPVASSHYNFSIAEPMGVVAIMASNRGGLASTVSTIAPVIAGANACVLIAHEDTPMAAVTFAEVLAHSDLPPGVVNIITGSTEDLKHPVSTHMEINALVYCGPNDKVMKQLQENCSTNLKRFFHWDKDWLEQEKQDPYYIMDLQEIKTTWHPIERIGASGSKY